TATPAVNAYDLFLTASGALLALSSEGRIETIDAELGTHTPYSTFGANVLDEAGLSLLTRAYDAETGHLYLESMFHGLVDISIPDGSIALQPSTVADCVGMSLHARQIVAICPSLDGPDSWSLQSIGGPSITNF